VKLTPTATPTTCADCGAAIAVFVCVSYYFQRSLCMGCYRAEGLRSKGDAEVRVLEWLFKLESA
jgi:hypothetical protein